MKNTKKKNPLAVPPRVGSSFQPSVPVQHLVTKKDDGSNQHETDFLWSVAQFLLTQPQYQTFSVTDAIQLSRALDIPPDEIRGYFDAWTKKLIRTGTIAKIPTCMDGEMFRVV